MKSKRSLYVLVSISLASLTHRCCVAVDQDPATTPFAWHKETAAERVRSARIAQEKAKLAYEEINNSVAANPGTLFRPSLHRPGPRFHELAAAAVSICHVNRIREEADKTFQACQQWHDSLDGDLTLRGNCYQAHDVLKKLMQAYSL